MFLQHCLGALVGVNQEVGQFLDDAVLLFGQFLPFDPLPQALAGYPGLRQSDEGDVLAAGEFKLEGRLYFFEGVGVFVGPRAHTQQIIVSN